MKNRKLLKLAVFNIIFVILEIILFSEGFMDLGGSDTMAALAVGAMSIAAFFGVNNWILNSSGEKKQSYKIEKIRTLHDYREALASWHNRNNPFNSELREAVHQLDLFTNKQAALKALLGEEGKESANPFMSVSEDVQECLLSNMRKLLNRMTIIDTMDQSKFPMHNEFIHHLLGQNRQLLSQYDNLIIEVSQIGDSKDFDTLHLDAITEALREMRDEHPTMGEYGAAMMMQQEFWEE